MVLVVILFHKNDSILLQFSFYDLWCYDFKQSRNSFDKTLWSYVGYYLHSLWINWYYSTRGLSRQAVVWYVEDVPKFYGQKFLIQQTTLRWNGWNLLREFDCIITINIEQYPTETEFWRPINKTLCWWLPTSFWGCRQDAVPTQIKTHPCSKVAAWKSKERRTRRSQIKRNRESDHFGSG